MLQRQTVRMKQGYRTRQFAVGNLRHNIHRHRMKQNGNFASRMKIREEPK